jgi:hypothetical protein
MLDPALGDQVLDRARYVLDWHVRVYAVLIEKVDDRNTKPLQRRVADLADVLGSAVEARLLLCLGIDIEAELTDENDSDEILTDHRLRFCQRQQVAIRMLHNVFTICLLQD